MKKAKAFSPCHITGFFQIADESADSLHVGSRGAGVSISRGTETIVDVRSSLKRAIHVKINGSATDSAHVSRQVVEAFLSQLGENGDFEVAVEHWIQVPIGAGFGSSGAAALSLALALNDALERGLSKIEAAQLAHIAEVECKTGLGTVIAENFGGVEVRVKPGAPGIGEIRRLTVSEDHLVVSLILGRLATRKFLTDQKTRQYINEFGGRLVDKLIVEPSLSNFLRFSRQFAENIGLINSRIRMILDETDKANFLCSTPIFGESVFTVVRKESLEDILTIFRRYETDAEILVSEIDFQGARLLK